MSVTSQIFSASAKNAAGGARPRSRFSSVVGGPPDPGPLSVNSAGNACAGNWDATGALCSPGTPGLATVTASWCQQRPNHCLCSLHVDSIQVTRLDPPGPALLQLLFSGTKWNYAATVFSNNLDITNTVGPINWTFSNSGVVNNPSHYRTYRQTNPTVLNQLENYR